MPRKPKYDVLVLRTCNADMTSRNGFKWPKRGPVSCNDWDPAPRCGNGLHGLAWGIGNAELMDWSRDAVWLVVGVKSSEMVDVGGKVKFPRGYVMYRGNRADAVLKIQKTSPDPKLCAGSTATAGDAGTATAGDAGTATAGNRGTATAGDAGTATAGNRGTATAGNRGTATAGNRGTATAGYAGTATAGYAGTVTAGDGGIIQRKYWDDKADRHRIATAYPGEDGIKPNVPYSYEIDRGWYEATND